MRTLFVALVLAGSLVIALAGSALASNHRKTSSECAAPSASAVANGQIPVGLTPDGWPAWLTDFLAGNVAVTGNDFRAAIASGVLIVDEDGFFVAFDTTAPATNGNSGAEHCPNV